jgi:hypothetical protein
MTAAAIESNYYCVKFLLCQYLGDGPYNIKRSKNMTYNENKYRQSYG